MSPKLFGVIDSYTAMVILGIVIAASVFEIYMRAFLKAKGDKVFYLEVCLLFATAIGIMGAYLFQNLYNFIEDSASFSWQWESTFFGGFLTGVGAFALLYGLWGRKKYPEGLRQVLSIGPGCLALGHGFGRIGCFLAGCCYGLPAEEWFGVKFVSTASKVIPTNLFEALFLFILAGILIYLSFQRRCEYAFSFYMLGYGAFRFLIEFLRNDHRGQFIPGLSPSQFWAIILFVSGIAYFLFFYFLRKKEKRVKEA